HDGSHIYWQVVFYRCHSGHRDRPSFPTRRSSDLLVLLDDESDATKTVSRLETLAAQGAVAYLGGFGSDLHAAAASVAEKNRTPRSEEHTSELQSLAYLVCRLLLEKKKVTPSLHVG